MSAYSTRGGIHRLYANKKTLKGYQSDRFSDGAVIVLDLLETKIENNAIVESCRKIVDVCINTGGGLPVPMMPGVVMKAMAQSVAPPAVEAGTSTLTVNVGGVIELQ